MNPRSPTQEGFRAMFRRPSIGLAEIAWRWSFGAACFAGIGFALLEYLDTLPVTRGDQVLLHSRHPALMSQAIGHIFRGSGFRLVEAGIVLTAALAAAWIAASALGRAATLKALVSYFQESTDALNNNEDQLEAGNWRLGSLAGLNTLRVGAALAAVIGSLAALLAGGAISSSTDTTSGSAFFVTLAVGLLVWLAWSMVNWFLSLASVLVVVEGQDAMGSLVAAIDLCRDKAGSVFAAGSWFGLVHAGVLFAAMLAAMFPLALATVLSGRIVLGGLLLITLAYLAAADFLYVGRLAAYVATLRLPQTIVAIEPDLPLYQYAAPVNHTSSGVDPDELILGDLPAPG